MQASVGQAIHVLSGTLPACELLFGKTLRNESGIIQKPLSPLLRLEPREIEKKNFRVCMRATYGVLSTRFRSLPSSCCVTIGELPLIIFPPSPPSPRPRTERSRHS